MKRSRNVKIHLSDDIKNQLRYSSKISASTKNIDTKLLFKSEHLKELSKFALNPSSRDVSHIKDRNSIYLPKITSNLPTNFDHLKQLYYSSDPLGMPYSVSSSNLVSSLSCKKQSCIEKVLTTHNSLSQDDFTPQSIERLSFGNPSGRQDIKMLQSWLREVKENNLELLQSDPQGWEIDLIEKAEIIYVMAGKELIRQVGVHCVERGEVLKEVLWFFSTVFKAQKAQYLKDLKEKLEKLNKEIEEKIFKHARQVSNYEIVIQKKSDKIKTLKQENEKINQMLKKTQINLIKLQSAQELKGAFFIPRLISPVLQKGEKSRAKDLDTGIKLLLIGNEENKDLKIRKKDLDESNMLTVNEVINREMLENDKTVQTGKEVRDLIENSTQTEQKISKAKHRFDFRSKVINNDLNLEIELVESIFVLPNSVFQEENLNKITITLPKQDFQQIDFADSGNALKSADGSLSNTENSQVAKKRSSVLPVSQDSFSKNKSKSSPLSPNEAPNSPRKMSQQLPSFTISADDVMIQNILVKQKAYSELSQSIKSKKSELSSLAAEIRESQKKLLKMKKEIQLRYLEIQSDKSPIGLSSSLRKLLLEKIESIIEKNEEDSEEENQDLDKVISKNFEIESWKAGYNAGIEKGVVIGFRQGEEFGIEIGEDQRCEEISEGSSSDESDKESKELNNSEESLNKDLGENERKGKRKTLKQEEKKIDLRGKRKERASTLNSSKSAGNFVQKSMTLRQRKPTKKILKKKNTEGIERVSNSSIMEDSKIIRTESINSQQDKPKPAKNRQSIKRTLLKKNEKREGFLTSSFDENQSDQTGTKKKKKSVEIRGKGRNENGQSHESSVEKVLKKQQTFTDYRTKEQITIIINDESDRKNSHDDLVKSNRLAIRHEKSRRNSSLSKSSKSDFEEDKQSISENESELEMERKKDHVQTLRKRIREITKFNEFRFHVRNIQLTNKKANPATKIIEKFLKKKIENIIKKSKMSKRMVFRQLNSIYLSFHSKSKDCALVEHLYDEFLQKYSVKSVCEKRIKDFLAALLKFSSCKRSMMFLRLSGISEKLNIKSYSSHCIPIYMQALNSILNSKFGIIMAVDETADQIMIPVVRVIECAKEIFEGKFEKNQMGRIVSKLESNSTRDPKKINSAGLIENELALEIILEYFEEYLKTITEGLGLVIAAIRYKEDNSVLLRGEFNMIFKHISPGKFKEEECDESQVISYEEVLSKCIEKNILSISEVRSFVYREERVVGDKEMKDDYSDFMTSLEKNNRKLRGMDPNTWTEKINKLYSGYQFRDILESFIAWRIYINELFN